jgi:hypothetical protein
MRGSKRCSNKNAKGTVVRVWIIQDLVSESNKNIKISPLSVAKMEIL